MAHLDHLWPELMVRQGPAKPRKSHVGHRSLSRRKYPQYVVEAIRAGYATGLFTQEALGILFGVSKPYTHALLSMGLRDSEREFLLTRKYHK